VTWDDYGVCLVENLEDEDWDRMIHGLREGDQQACSEFWNRFGPMLEGVARQRLSERLQRRVGPDDVVQSACRTFFRRVSSGQFELPDSDALWRLMCAITLTKARRAARDHSRQKRSMQSEQYLDDRSDDSERRPSELPGNLDAPFEAAAFSDQMNVLLQSLSPEECQVLDLKLQNHTNDEIAEQMKCSERTVRRITQQIRSRWSTLFEETDDVTD
jgi:RNA polymerase sigma factor (sigma-70 family)